MDNRTLRAGISLTVLALCAAGCMADSDIADDDQEAAVDSESELSKNGGVALGACYNGASSKLYPIDPSAPRCTLAQVWPIYEWAFEDSLPLHQFLWNLEFDDIARIQCHPYFDEVQNKELFCADVVDRYLDDSTLEKGTVAGVDARNFFVLYHEDWSGSPIRAFFDAQLANTNVTDEPVSLSVAGWILKNGELRTPEDGEPLGGRETRLLKFDPRDCTYCGTYAGPGLDKLNPTGLSQVNSTSLRWWPTLTTSCKLEKQMTVSGGTPLYAELGAHDCLAEQNYRATSR